MRTALTRCSHKNTRHSQGTNSGSVVFLGDEAGVGVGVLKLLLNTLTRTTTHRDKNSNIILVFAYFPLMLWGGCYSLQNITDTQY